MSFAINFEKPIVPQTKILTLDRLSQAISGIALNQADYDKKLSPESKLLLAFFNFELKPSTTDFFADDIFIDYLKGTSIPDISVTGIPVEDIMRLAKTSDELLSWASLIRTVDDKNACLKKLTEMKAPLILLFSVRRRIRGIVDQLIDNRHCNTPVTGIGTDAPMSSLSDYGYTIEKDKLVKIEESELYKYLHEKNTDSKEEKTEKKATVKVE